MDPLGKGQNSLLLVLDVQNFAAHEVGVDYLERKCILVPAWNE